MLILFQFILVVAFLACWASAMLAYLGSTREKRPDAKYVDPWTSEGLTEKGAELRRLYWQVMLCGVGVGVVLGITFLFGRHG